MHFGEYELSPGLIGLSLLRTGHPKAFRLYALFGLAFAPAPNLRLLASPMTTTRRLIMQKARRHRITRLRPLVGAWFQGLFHSPSGVLFTFSSRYWFAIGLSVVFSLTGWSPWIRPGFLVSRLTQVPLLCLRASRTGLSPAAARRSMRFRSPSNSL